MEIQFILVEPQYPENVGSVARAIKTMGFTNLVLINPCDYLSKEAKWLAHGSIDMLENAIVYNTLEEAVSQVDFVVATTSKKRKTNFNYYLPNEISELLIKKSESISKVGILFGREDTGLKNEELKFADIITTVPIKCSYPSINLAQTVMIYAYELSKLKLLQEENQHVVAEEFKYKLLKGKLSKLLEHIDIKEDSNLYNRLFERVALTGSEDVNLILSFLNKNLERLKK